MTLRLLQVGMGGFGRSWANTVVPQVDGVELVACVDIDPTSLEKAQAMSDLPDDRYFSSLPDALHAVEADAVLVTTSIGGHMTAIMTALEAGKHVLTEKPFVPTVAEAERAVAAATARHLILQVSQNYRFFPAVEAVSGLTASSALGRLDGVYIDFRRYDNSAPVGNHVHYRVPEPMLVDMAIHHFDLMRAVIGTEPERIECRTWNPPWSKFDDPPEATATVVFAGGTTVNYRGSWLSPGPPTPWAGEWRMEFEDGEVQWTSRGGGTTRSEADEVWIRPLGKRRRRLELPEMRYLGREGSLSAFAQAVASGEEPPTSGRRNIPTLALTLASVQAAAVGTWVEIQSYSGCQDE